MMREEGKRPALLVLFVPCLHCLFLVRATINNTHRLYHSYELLFLAKERENKQRENHQSKMTRAHRLQPKTLPTIIIYY